MVATLDETGTVVDMARSQRVDSLSDVEFYNGILIPPLVNAHCHLELSHLRGAIAPGGGLCRFAREVVSMRGGRPEVVRATAEYRDARMWSEGIGIAGDVSNDAVSFAVKKKSRIAYHTFIELSGLYSGARARAEATLAAAGELDHSLTPHSTYSLYEADFRHAATTGEGPLSVHFMESVAERELFEGRGELFDWYMERGLEVDFLHYGSPAERIIRNVPSSRRIMLVHNTFMGREELDALAARFGDNLTLALCPRSNIYISGTLPPVAMLRRSGVRIALGTDSLASNSSLSLVEEMKLLPDAPLEELLGWVTSNGAEALGTTSRLEPGSTGGVVLLSGVDPRTRTITPAATTKRII